MTEQLNHPPIIAELDDIDREHARRAFYWTSMTPEKRGEQRRQEYADAVNGLYAELWALAKTGEQQDLLAAEMERYRQGYRSRMNAWLSSHASVASAMITGPARFPTERNRKRGQWADNKANELLAWDEKAREAIKRKLLDARPEEEKAASAWSQLAREIGRSLETIGQIDRGENTWSARSLFVSSIAGKVERLAVHGETELVRKALQLVSTFNAQNGKPAITGRHKFWTYAELAERMAAQRVQGAGGEPDTIAEAEGVKIIANHAADRVQILFDEKPAREVIARLKGEAWNWSPREGAWQRKLTAAAKDSAKRIIDIA